MAVVELLEVVDIDHQHAYGLLAPERPRTRLCQTFVKVRPVGNAQQAVGARKGFQLLVGIAQYVVGACQGFGALSHPLLQVLVGGDEHGILLRQRVVQPHDHLEQRLGAVAGSGICLALPGLLWRRPGGNGHNLPRQRLIGTQDVQAQPRSQKPHNGFGGIGQCLAHRPDGFDLLDKLRVLRLVRCNVAWVDPHALHQGLFIGKMVLGIRHQPRKGVGQHLFAAAIGAVERLAQFVEQIDQRMVLVVNILYASDEILIPYESIHWRRPRKSV